MKALGFYYGGLWAPFDHPNALGSTQMATMANGGAMADYELYPWGDVWQEGGTTNYDENFGGMLRQFNQYYLTRFRRYLVPEGRWLTPDPLGGDIWNPQSLNRYAYVMNNPSTLTDPLGLFIAMPQPPPLPPPCDASQFYRASYAGPACGPGAINIGGATIAASGGGGGGSAASAPGNPQTLPKDKKPPYECSATAVMLNSLDVNVKLGFELDTPILKIGFALFKNLKTNQKGGELVANYFGFGGEVERTMPPGAPINSEAGPPQAVADLGPVQHNFSTGRTTPTPVSHFLSFGGAFGVGGSLSFNMDRFNSQVAACGEPVVP